MSRGFSVQPRAARVKSALRPDRTSNYATSVHLGRYGLPMEREGDVVADGRVDREKLAELLALGAEQEALDFKATLDLSDPKHQVDHIKDILSMMSLLDGGYLVVGVDNAGRVEENQPPIDPRQFDSAVLLQKTASFVDGRLDIRSAVYELDNQSGERRPVALIYCGPPPGLLPLVVKRSGEYPTAGGKARVVLRVGQIVIREGTTTTALRPDHWQHLLERHVDRARKAARRDADALMSRVVALLETSERTGSAQTPIDVDMDSRTFATAAISLIESGNQSRLEQFLIPTTGILRSLVARDDYDAATEVLDKVFSLASVAMLYGTLEQFSRVMKFITTYYSSIPGISDSVHNSEPGERRRAQAWLDVLIRLYALGALAVRQAKWLHLREMVAHPYNVTPNYGYASWLRHALTSAARADLLTPGKDSDDEASLRAAAVISRARKVALRAPELRPDLPGNDEQSEVLIDSLCQFDILWCIIAQSSSRRPDRANDFYPSSSELDQQRANPAFDLVATDEDAREQLFAKSPSRVIAEALLAVFKVAETQSWKFSGWWSELPPATQVWVDRETGDNSGA
ncbi:hypothetical protein Q0F99_11430 [Rathayibacter oskolensis]|uniref:AlbA family DNA-binding domain-containing protein n=1 Tax=Rathayibacter oskolensis TaxID=1891671 RepID=UPI00265E7396|nr:hypothetical protein [Rathayibacter oskolensis]WKK70476.1 hypothetical protein Q0F99_11430 [Rathayibacter oskolensis]